MEDLIVDICTSYISALLRQEEIRNPSEIAGGFICLVFVRSAADTLGFVYGFF